MRAVTVSGLVAGYAGLPVVRDFDLHVDHGEVVALLGPSGAGKSTTLLTIAGVLSPIAGEVDVLGSAVTRGRPHIVARRGLALVPEGRGVFGQLTVEENLRLCRRSSTAPAVEEALELFPPLRARLAYRASLLSGGEQQMLALAKSLMASPKVLLIDELSLGLAPTVVRALLPTVRRLATERRIAVVLVEQHVRLALEIADRAYVLRSGELRWAGPASEIANQQETLEVTYFGTPQEETS